MDSTTRGMLRDLKQRLHTASLSLGGLDTLEGQLKGKLADASTPEEDRPGLEANLAAVRGLKVHLGPPSIPELDAWEKKVQDRLADESTPATDRPGLDAELATVRAIRRRLPSLVRSLDSAQAAIAVQVDALSPFPDMGDDLRRNT